MEKKSAWLSYTDEEKKELTDLNEDYKAFLSQCKTERECVVRAVDLAKEQGYRPIEEFIEKGIAPKTGDKIYAVCMDKTLAMFHIGRKPLECGMNILGAHIDSPRMDVKQYPLYESGNMAYLDTHYYGGIKKYQWVTIPLSIHGVVVKKDGTKVVLNIGDKEGDPVFCVTDLLIHLASGQMEKKATKVVEGEDLDILIGNTPLEGKEKDAVYENVLKILSDQIGIEEADFQSAEIEIVPAGDAKDMGLDRSMILSYGQDDRVCAYTSLRAMLEMETQEKTRCCLLVDKEEIGSVGATGMQSRFFENTVAELVNLVGGGDIDTRRCLSNSRMLSSDVDSGYDPLYADVFDTKNTAYIGNGVVFNKYTGSRGKSGSNDANAEYLADLRRIMDDNKVQFQLSELGKVDAGGGGTIAYIMALYGMEVIDCGVAVLNMHAPWEVTSKADVYEAYKCYKAFIKNA